MPGKYKRVYKRLVSNEELTEVAQALWKEWSDTTNPANELVRPVKDICIQCGKEYMRRLSVLADSGVCSEACMLALARAIEAWESMPIEGVSKP